ncbi:hypothetical protein ACFL6F_03920, partial [Planctomycetota bacterium]
LKILYIEKGPRWEYRFLKNSLLRDKMTAVSILLLSADQGFRQEGDVPVNTFPSQDDLKEYDTIILGNVPAAFFTDRQMLDIAESVEKRGVGLVWMPGSTETAASYINTPIEDILPVTLLKTEVYTVFEDEKVSRPFRPKIRETAWEHPVMQLADDRDTNKAVWGNLPSMYSFIRTGKIKPGKSLLAEYPVRSSLEKPEVIFATGFYGIGKCFYSAIDSTWRWRFQVGDLYFYRFWLNVLRYVSSGRFAEGREACFILADNKYHIIGKQVAVTALIRDKDFNPVSAPAWEIEVEDPQGSQRTIKLKPVEGSQGYFKGVFIPPLQGMYAIYLKDAEGIRKEHLKIKVEVPRGEITHVLMNVDGLKNALAKTGGGFFTIEEADKILKKITTAKGHRREEILKTDIEIFNHWILFLLIVCSVTGEWILRKIYRLA